MSAVYRNNGYLATDCPACGQEVRVDRQGEEFTFTCRGGHSDLEVRAGLPPEVMLELAAASRQRPDPRNRRGDGEGSRSAGGHR